MLLLVSPATTLPVSSPLVDARTSSYTFPSAVVMRFGLNCCLQCCSQFLLLASVVSLAPEATLAPSASTPTNGVPSSVW